VEPTALTDEKRPSPLKTHKKKTSHTYEENKVKANSSASFPLNRYQFNPHLARDETITNILTKALTVFPSPDYSLCLSLLPPQSLTPNPQAHSLAEAVQKLSALHAHLVNAQYEAFWTALDGDDLYADLSADVQGFEEMMRVRVAVVVSQCMQSVERGLLEAWLNVKDEAFERFVGEVCGWKIEGSEVLIPLNKENEARSTVVRENVKFDQLGRTVRRAYEQPA